MLSRFTTRTTPLFVPMAETDNNVTHEMPLKLIYITCSTYTRSKFQYEHQLIKQSSTNTVNPRSIGLS